MGVRCVDARTGNPIEVAGTRGQSAEGMVCAGPSFELKDAGFLHARMEVDLDLLALERAGVEPRSVRLFKRAAGGKFELVSVSGFDVASGRLLAESIGAGHYCAFAPRPMTGEAVDGAIRPRLHVAVSAAHRIDELDRYLAARPGVANAMTWYYPALSAFVPYPQWPASDQWYLHQVYWQIKSGHRQRLSDMPPYTYLPSDPGFTPSVGYDPSVAWKYYIAHVAHSLVLDAGNRLPWSLEQYPASQLAVILSGDWFYHYDPFNGLYQLVVGAPRPGSEGLFAGGVTLCDPEDSYDFLQGRSMVGATRAETISSVVDWCRGLSHFFGFWDLQVFLDHWQYGGFPPVNCILRGTTHPVHGFAHWTAGCFGTAGLLQAMLRNVNIPVVPRGSPTHALVRFPSEGWNLSHGDDPYDRAAKRTPPIPIEEYFIDDATFLTWFNQNLGSQTLLANVGRQPRELMLLYLTDWLLADRCDDIANRKSAEQSSVFAEFSGLYTLADLVDLWRWLDDAIAARGGCANIVRP